MKSAQKFIQLAETWKGKKESDGTHKEIIDVYNTFRPLPRGYKVKYTDAWCATFVSAVAIKLGYTDIIPPECSCVKMIERFKTLGVFIENENRTPNVGDVCFYDWQDDGKGDNKGNPDHVGIVTNVSRETFIVLEGNYNNSVKERVLQINGRYIRGFAVPKYDVECEGVNTMQKYIVQKGDTLSAIAKRFGTSVLDIMKANTEVLRNENVIGVGWVLNIPVSEGSENRYEAIGRAFEKCWGDVENLDSYKELMKLME